MLLQFSQTPTCFTPPKRNEERYPFYALQKPIWKEVHTLVKEPYIDLLILNCERDLPTPLLNRLYNWIELFGNYSFITGLHSHMIPVLLVEIRKDSLLTDQTSYEFELSCRFFQVLFDSQPNLYLENSRHSKCILQIILVMSRYPGMIRTSILRTFTNLSWALSDRKLLDLFSQLFCKYKLPKPFLSNFFQLNEIEIGAVMHLLQGANIRTYAGLPLPISKKESYYFIDGPPEGVVIEDSILVRLSIWSKLAVSCQNDLSMVEYLLRHSKAFAFRPEEFLVNIEYWKQVLQILVKAEASFPFAYEATDFIDFFELKNQDKKNDYCLKGRTPLSIYRDMEREHSLSKLDEINNLRNTQWPGMNLKPYETGHEGQKYIIDEITDRKSLYKESFFLKHCASSYSPYCEDGLLSLFSIKKKIGRRVKHLVTIELRDNTVVQARGLKNRMITKPERDILREWAERYSLQIKYSI